MSEYSVDLKDLTQDRISLEGAFEPGALDFTGNDFRQFGPLVWSAHVERVGEEIRITIIDGAVEWSWLALPGTCTCGISRSFDLSSDSAMMRVLDEECRAAQGMLRRSRERRFDNDAIYRGCATLAGRIDERPPEPFLFGAKTF